MKGKRKYFYIKETRIPHKIPYYVAYGNAMDVSRPAPLAPENGTNFIQKFSSHQEYQDRIRELENSGYTVWMHVFP